MNLNIHLKSFVGEPVSNLVSIFVYMREPHYPVRACRLGLVSVSTALVSICTLCPCNPCTKLIEDHEKLPINTNIAHETSSPSQIIPPAVALLTLLLTAPSLLGLHPVILRGNSTCEDLNILPARQSHFLPKQPARFSISHC